MDANSATLQLPKDLIEAAINTNVSAAIVAALGDKSGVIDKLIGAILSQKVDSEGKSGNYRSEIPFITWAVNDALQKAIRETIQEEVQKYKDEIKKQLIAELKKKRSPLLAQLVDSMANGIVDCAASSWKITVQHVER